MTAFKTSQIKYRRPHGHFNVNYSSTYPSFGSMLSFILGAYHIEGCFTNCSSVELTKFYLCVSKTEVECH